VEFTFTFNPAGKMIKKHWTKRLFSDIIIFSLAINEITGSDEEEYIVSGSTERRWLVEIFAMVLWKQFLSREPNELIFIRLHRDSVRYSGSSIIVLTERRDFSEFRWYHGY